MRRYLVALSTCLMLALTLCACDKQITVDPVALAEQLYTQIAYEDQLSLVSKQVVVDLFGIDPDKLEQSVVYMSSGATAEEIAVFVLKTTADAQAVEQILERRVTQQHQAFADYVPKELIKLDAAVIEAEDRYVALCVSNESRKAEAIIDAAFADD